VPCRYLYIAAVAALASCQGAASATNDTPAPELTRDTAKPAGPVSMVATIKDSKKKIADIQSGRPCRVQIDGTDFIVGIEPFVMMVGEAKYDGSVTGESIVFTRSEAAVARVMESGDELAVFNPDGTALFRVSANEGVVRNGVGSPIREIRREGEAFLVSSSAGDIYVTGPADVLLAAVLTATEASPEVRALAACHRMQKVRP